MDTTLTTMPVRNGIPANQLDQPILKARKFEVRGTGRVRRTISR